MPKKTPKTIEEKRKERRKNTAEVFTPQWLAQEMLDKIPEDFWNDPNKTLLEPACGDGIFVVLSIEKRLKYGHGIHDIIKNTYAMDIMKDNIQICRDKVYQIILRELNLKYHANSKEKEDIDCAIKICDELVELTCVLLHNIFRVNDTLTFDFDKFKPWIELKGKAKENNKKKMKTFLKHKGLIIE